MTSLNVALSSAVSSLLVIEKQMGVTSNNIANANTVGYSQESVILGSSVSGGYGTGVSDLGTTSNVDQFLLAAMQSASTASSQSSAYSKLYQNLQNALGTITTNTTGGNDLASQMSTLESALTTLATTPNDKALDSKVVQALGNLTANLRSISSQIQSLRTTADANVSSIVTDANNQLNTINGINKQIAVARGQGQPTAALEDLRNNALTALTSDLGVNAYVNANDQMQIFTTSGVPLLVGDGVIPISHTAVSISSTTSYANGTINGIMVGNTDITSSIGSGSLAANIQMRDTELPNAQSALDTLAQNVTGVLNAISNQGSANPPPSTLTSATGTSFAATDAVTPSANLKIRVAMVDGSGNVQSYRDIDLSSATSVGGPSPSVVSLINAAFGGPPPTVASLNGSGQLVLSSTTTGQGIAVSTISGTLSGAGSTSATNFSSFFHLNDVVTGGNSASTISVNSTLLQNSYLFPTGTLNTTNTGTPPFSGIGASDGTTATAIANALLGTQTFNSGSATGTLTQQSATAALGLTGTFTIHGSTGQVTIAVSPTDSLSTIASNITAAAGGTGITAKVVGTGSYQLQIGGGGTSVSFTNNSGSVLSSLGLASNPTGYLGSTTTTLAGYASAIISDVASRASTASTDATNKTTTLNTLKNNLSSQSGVNTDEETAKLTQLQSAYSASARVVSTVQAMFNALISAVSA